MEINLEPDKYVVAVSGGVDSVVLLHVLCQQPDLELIVAHFDHGIRSSSTVDRVFVEELSEKYKLPFVYENGQLGPQASEATARTARYAFLDRARKKHGADAILTAHHRDDVLETAVINLLRGTGRKGLSSLGDQPHIQRPLLRVTKAEILDYARRHTLAWHEDETNSSDAYLRNYVRHHILPRFSDEQKKQLWLATQQAQSINKQLDTLLVNYQEETLDKKLLSTVPHNVARELVATWLRGRGISDFDRRTLERLVVAAKTAAIGKHFDVLHGKAVVVQKQQLELA